MVFIGSKKTELFSLPTEYRVMYYVRVREWCPEIGVSKILIFPSPIVLVITKTDSSTVLGGNPTHYGSFRDPNGFY